MRNKKYLTDFKLTIESDKVDTVIGSSVTINGPISSKKDVRVDGKVLGGITTKGCVFLGPQSFVEGNIKGKHVTVCGKVNGDVSAKGRIIIASKAHVSGNLSMSQLVVDEGATFNGVSSMDSDKVYQASVKDNQDDETVLIEYEDKER